MQLGTHESLAILDLKILIFIVIRGSNLKYEYGRRKIRRIIRLRSLLSHYKKEQEPIEIPKSV